MVLHTYNHPLPPPMNGGEGTRMHSVHLKMRSPYLEALLHSHSALTILVWIHVAKNESTPNPDKYTERHGRATTSWRAISYSVQCHTAELFWLLPMVLVVCYREQRLGHQQNVTTINGVGGR